jgi:transmembrane sensor
VLVMAGKVSVNQAATTAPSPSATGAVVAVPAHFLVAGEQATVALPTKGNQALPPVVVAAVAAPRLESALAWQEGRLEFTDTPLAEVVAEFNRYNRHQLTIGDPTLGAEPFGGSFAARGFEAFIEVLEQSFAVVADRRGSETILRRAPGAGRSR